VILHPQYITDASGKPVSVVLPLEEFESLLEQADAPTPQELAESDAAWQNWLSGQDQGVTLERLQQDLRTGILQADTGTAVDGESAFRGLLPAEITGA
jgi:hypothetical protein